MPSASGCASTCAAIAWLPSCMARLSAPARSDPGWSSSSLARVATMIWLANSPAAWPPMPSASTRTRGAAYAESSLLSRTIPVWERAA